MNKELNFFKTSMPKTRKADYYLGCLDCSVFIDFVRLKSNLIVLCRISFDGHGCCNLDSSAIPLDQQDSKLFLEEMKKETFNQEIITLLVKKTIKINKKQIWKDALKQYGLIDE